MIRKLIRKTRIITKDYNHTNDVDIILKNIYLPTLPLKLDLRISDI